MSYGDDGNPIPTDLPDDVVNAIHQMMKDRDKILIDKNSPVWGLFLVLEQALDEIKRERSWAKTAPEFDATPFADPSWERGHEYGVSRILEIWAKALAGVETGGNYNDPELQRLYAQTVALVKHGT